MKIVLALAAAAVVVQPALATPPPLAPSSKWVLESSDETCRLIRRFGTDQPVTLSFEQAAERGPLAMMATGGSLRLPGLRAEATADFEPIALAHFVADSAARTADGHDVLIWRSVSFSPTGKVAGGSAGRRRSSSSKQVPLEVQAKRHAEAFQRERETNGVRLQVGRGGDPVLLETGSMGPPMTALRQCLDQQLASWGLDPKVERTIVTPPVALSRPDSWLAFSGSRAPALKRDQLAPVNLRLLVDSAGKVTSCKARSIEGAAFEAALCAHIAKSAQLLPAKAADGKPVPSYLLATVRRASP